MSIELYVVRHADAGDADPSRWPDDMQRPLTDSGEKTFRKAAAFLRARAERPQIVYASPAVRAQQTAQLLTEAAAWPSPLSMTELWGTEPGVVVDALVGTPKDSRLALVGHDPMLSELVGRLGGGRVALKKGGIAFLRVEDFGATDAELRWLIWPELFTGSG